MTMTRNPSAAVEGTASGEHLSRDVERVMSEYREQRRRLDALLHEARELGARFERLAHGLSAHPERLLVDFQGEPRGNLGDREIVPSHPLPSIEHLGALTEERSARSLCSSKTSANDSFSRVVPILWNSPVGSFSSQMRRACRGP